ncbi:hypothetical protein [Sphingosinicella sp. BN140058]|uniref:hypothetical protein n=1 Tax=Sphingosinicella sp. BN140058 TaxID=1892855 RepID=UPI001011E7FD|nr:hypothetical protein [Sphingosinicella sp. BN140058]QAY80438.1 hypothetical protein ETR14_27755 [Sphingosinicella sp. BN140058]
MPEPPKEQEAMPRKSNRPVAQDRWLSLGSNRIGEPLFHTADGVRSRLKDGKSFAREIERFGPEAGGDPLDRLAIFLTRDEYRQKEALFVHQQARQASLFA